MPKNANSKLRPLLLLDYLRRKTDAEHGVTMEQILAYLKSMGAPAERKTIYDDVEKLRTVLGYDIEPIRAPRFEYRLVSREFEDAELRILADAVCASRFITAKKSDALIKKLERLTSEYTQRELSRQILVENRVKVMNESILYNVDAIHSAIRERRKIEFKYFDYNIKKERVERHSGEAYRINPIALSFSEGNYYLIAYNDARGALNNYRVDRMLGISVCDEGFSPAASEITLDVSRYENKQFSMYGGERKTVTLVFSGSLANVAIDRFGKQVTAVPRPDGRFSISVPVAVGPTFFGWIAQFGADAVIESPAEVAQQYLSHLETAAAAHR